MAIVYDTPIEVNLEQYNYLKVEYRGIIAYREEAGRYWIKVWDMKYARSIAAYVGM